MRPHARTAALAIMAAALGATASGAQAGATSYNTSKANTSNQTVGQGDADFIAKCTALKGVVSGKSPHLICTYPAPPVSKPANKPDSGRIC